MALRVETEPTERSSLAALVSGIGFRRLHAVSVTAQADGLSAWASGVVHRSPRTVPISVTLAKRLIAAGAPLCVVDQRRPEAV